MRETSTSTGPPALAERARALLPLLLLFCLPAASCFPSAAEETPVADVRLADLEKRHREETRTHLLPEGLIVYRMDWPDSLAKRYNRACRQADGAYFQGLYAASLAQRAALTGDADAREEALKAYLALHRLMVQSGYEGLVARSFGKRSLDDEGYEVRNDASGDQVTGFVWGTYWAWKCLPLEEVRRHASADMTALVAHLRRHDLKVHRSPDEPTRFGDYDADVLGIVPIGHRAVGALAIALVARLVCDGPAGTDFFGELVKKDYHRFARYFYPWFPHSSANTVNYLLNLYLTWVLDESPHRRSFYAVGRESAWRLTHLWQMSLYAALYKAMEGKEEARDREDALRRLRNLPTRYTWFRDEIVRWRANVVPLERRPSCTTFWSKSPRLELMEHGKPWPVRIARIDFLVAYWFGRFHGYYREDE
ncbi:MAG: hypothetical protein ACYS47_17970 [Planctomycetota bacterium]|jgi:hypothetical protein